MKKKNWIIFILAVFILGNACVVLDGLLGDWDDFNPSDYSMEDESSRIDAADKDEEQPQEVAGDDVDADEGDTENSESEEAKGQEDVPPVEDDRLQVIMDYSGLTHEQKVKIWLAYWDDPEADWISHIAEIILTTALDETDLRIMVGIILRLNDNATTRYFGNTLFPCDSEIEGGFVVCTDDPLPIEPGDVIMFVMKLAAKVPPANPDRHYTYAVVVDADGDPSNNFIFNPPYNWDYFQNTDRWYALNWNPDMSEWTLSVADFAQQEYISPSAARAVVMDDTITFFIPATEFSIEYPTYRMTAFGDDGTFSQESYCGDVSGADPTEPLTPVHDEIIVVE